MKTKLATLFAGYIFFFAVQQLQAANGNTFRAIGKVTEAASDHTTLHEHKLKFVRLNDGEVFEIVDSPELIKEHCQSEKNPVIEIEGYRTGKFLFWGGDLVITSFKIHQDIEVPRMAHVDPNSIPRAKESIRSSRL